MTSRHAGLSRVIVAATNDNLPAPYFYQRRGYRITEVVQAAASQHAAAPAATGFAEIPVLDELRLEKRLRRPVRP